MNGASAGQRRGSGAGNHGRCRRTRERRAFVLVALRARLQESTMKVPFLCSAVFAAAVLLPSVALADNPQHFLRKAIEGDNSEMMLGRMAQSQAENDGVRNYGRTLASDHRQARADAVRTATRMGVRGAEWDRDVAPEARDERDRLSSMRGREFDREFIRYMIDDHRKDISDFRDEAREDHGPASQMAQRQLPTLQKHLDIALSLQPRLTDRNVGYQYRDRGFYDRRDRANKDYRDRNSDSGAHNGYDYNR